MKNAYRLFAGLLVVTMTALAYADVVTLPTEGAGSIDSATIVAPMSPDTPVWVQNTFGNEIELYSGTTPAVPSGSQGLMIGGTENTAKIKVITNCMQNLGQTTVMNNGTLRISANCTATGITQTVADLMLHGKLGVLFGFHTYRPILLNEISRSACRWRRIRLRTHLRVRCRAYRRTCRE